MDLTYTAQDEIATETRYKDLGGTQTVGTSSFTYDALGQLTNLQHKDGNSNLLANYTYTYRSFAATEEMKTALSPLIMVLPKPFQGGGRCAVFSSQTRRQDQWRAPVFRIG